MRNCRSRWLHLRQGPGLLLPLLGQSRSSYGPVERLKEKPAGNPTNRNRRARNQAAGGSKPPGRRGLRSHDNRPGVPADQGRSPPYDSRRCPQHGSQRQGGNAPWAARSAGFLPQLADGCAGTRRPYEKIGAALHTEITDVEGRAASRDSLACAPLTAASAANAPPFEIAERVTFRRRAVSLALPRNPHRPHSPAVRRRRRRASARTAACR